MIEVTPEQMEEIRRILGQHLPGVEVLALGSRVKGLARRYSDLDLVVRGDATLSIAAMGELQLSFQESDLPFRVDIVDWHKISAAFRACIEECCEVVMERESSERSTGSAVSLCEMSSRSSADVRSERETV